MVKIKLLKLIAIILSVLTVITNPINAEAQDINEEDAPEFSISVTPGVIERKVEIGTEIIEEIEIRGTRINQEDLLCKFWEYDLYFEVRVESEPLQRVSKCTLKKDSEIDIVRFEVDTKNFADQTYFYGLELLMLNRNTSDSIEKNISILIPFVVTTYNKDSDNNPLPQVNIRINSSFLFWSDEITAIVNQKNISRKYITIGSELIFLNDKGEELYSEKIPVPSDRLVPDQGIEKTLKRRPIDSFFPYFGNVKIVVRSTINGEKHVETNPITIFILPKEYVIALIILLIVALLVGRFGYIKYLEIKSKQQREKKEEPNGKSK